MAVNTLPRFGTTWPYTTDCALARWTHSTNTSASWLRIRDLVFIVTRLYEKLNIGSFNEVFLLDRFQRGTDRPRSKFRAVATFITREVDLAVSELSMAYVVDKLPEHTCNEARHYLGEMNLWLAARS